MQSHNPIARQRGANRVTVVLPYRRRAQERRVQSHDWWMRNVSAVVFGGSYDSPPPPWMEVEVAAACAAALERRARRTAEASSPSLASAHVDVNRVGLSHIAAFLGPLTHGGVRD